MKWFALILLLTACKAKQPLIINNHTRTTVRDSIVKDTIMQTLQDSAWLQLYLKCVDGRVVIDKELQKMSRDLKMIHSFENGMLKIQADYYNELLMEVDKLYRIIETTKSETVIIQPEPEKAEKKLRWWQEPISYGLWVLIIMVLIWIANKIWKA